MCTDAKIAEKYGVAAAGQVVVTDWDGAELARGGASASEVAGLMDAAIKKLDAPVAWAGSLEEGRRQAKEKGQVLLVLFEDDSEASKKTLEAFSGWKLGQLRKKLVCVKLAYSKDKPGPDAEALKISSAPGIALLNLKEADADKQVLSRRFGLASAGALRGFLDGAIKRVEEGSKDRGPSPFKKN